MHPETTWIFFGLPPLTLSTYLLELVTPPPPSPDVCSYFKKLQVSRYVCVLGKHKSLVNFWTSSCKPKPSKNEVLLPQNEGGGVIHDHFQSQTFVLQKICVQFRFKKVNFRSARSPSISVDTGIGVVATYIITYIIFIEFFLAKLEQILQRILCMYIEKSERQIITIDALWHKHNLFSTQTLVAK